MKNFILLFLVVGFITSTATTKSFFPNEKSTVSDSTHKACIDACSASIASCKKVQEICAKDHTGIMAECEKACKDCIQSCTKSVILMKENNSEAKSHCLESAKIAEQCALACDKFDKPEFKKCAADCRTAAKHCNAMQ